MQHCTLNEILKSANSLPFEQKHIKFLLMMLKKQYMNGLIVRFHPMIVNSPAEALKLMEEGMFVLSCPQISSDFVFTCENAGKGLFGGQKRVFKIFIGDYSADDFTAANTFKSFALAVTSINNIFRGNGLLKGMV
jgi:hypothetical protein